jgi:outer membrane lipoprotein SlyB
MMRAGFFRSDFIDFVLHGLKISLLKPHCRHTNLLRGIILKSSSRNIVFAALALTGLFTLSGCFEEKAKETAAAPAPVVEIAPAASAPVVAAPVAAPAPAPVAAPAPKPAAKPKPVAPKAAAAAPAPVKIVCDICGTVVAVNMVEVAGKESGAGVVIGGAVGGLLGNQLAKSKDKELATLAGAVGGAVAGHYIEKNMKKSNAYDVVVKLENGEERTLRHTADPALVAGDKIKIEGELAVKQ